MKHTADPTHENYTRLPAFYRRRKSTEDCAPNRNYQIENAGTRADGTPLLAIHASEAA